MYGGKCVRGNLYACNRKRLTPTHTHTHTHLFAVEDVTNIAAILAVLLLGSEGGTKRVHPLSHDGCVCLGQDGRVEEGLARVINPITTWVM